MTGFVCIGTRQESFGIFNNFRLSAILLCLGTVHCFGKKMIFHEIFQVGACPNLKDSSLYERYSIHMYKAKSNLYLQPFSPICESFFPCALHFVWKKMIFHEIFQVGACPNLKDSFLYHRLSIHMYKARSIRYLQQFLLYLQLSYALYGTFFQKKMIFHEIFQVGACPNLKDSLLYAGFLFICTRHETFGIFNIFPLSATPLCPVRYIFLKKMNF